MALEKLFANLGFGLGLRSSHYSKVLKGRPQLKWFEVITENFLIDGGRPLYLLEQLRKTYPIAAHGVSLSLGSSDPLDFSYLKRLKDFMNRFEPTVVSDHCCWTQNQGENLHDLLPLPYTKETAKHVADRIACVQDFIGKRILIENVSSYLSFKHSEMEEWEFLVEISNQADCGLLLDVNNVYVSSVNHSFDPHQYLNALPSHRIGQIHLAGHTTRELPNGKKFLIDTHDQKICSEVWALYNYAVNLFGPTSTMIERDANIPDIGELEEELKIAKRIQNEIRSKNKTKDKSSSSIKRASALDEASYHPT